MVRKQTLTNMSFDIADFNGQISQFHNFPFFFIAFYLSRLLLFQLLFSTCQMRHDRFYINCPPPSSLLFLLILLLTGPHRSQWALPDLICQLLIAPDRCRPPRASTGENLSAVGLAGPQPARFGALWATGEILRAVGLARPQPDLNRQNQSHIECQRKCQIKCQKEYQKIYQIEYQKIYQIE